MIELLDIKTLIIAGVAINFYMCVILLVYGVSQKTYPGYRYWLVANILSVITYVFYGLRGVIPDLLSIPLANAITILFSIVRLEGVKRFDGQKKVWYPNFILPILILLIFPFLTSLNESSVIRNTIISAIGIPITLKVAWIFWKNRKKNSKTISCFMVGLLALYALLLVVRALIWIFLPEHRGVMTNTAPNILFTILNLLFDISWPVLFILLNGHRMNEEIKSLTAQLEQFASVDALTGILNRRKFLELSEKELARSLRYGHKLSLLMFDLDRFKDVNDTFGHAAGDEVLKQISTVCTGQLRANDAFGRLGGDEFVILLPETDEATAASIAHRLEENILSLPFRWKHQVKIGFSYGIAELQPGESNVDQLMARADTLLYEMKSRRHNRSPILK